MREIKGAVLGRLPYYLIWQLPICTSLFPPLLIAFGSFDYRAYYCLLQLFLPYYCLAVVSFILLPVHLRLSFYPVAFRRHGTSQGQGCRP